MKCTLFFPAYFGIVKNGPRFEESSLTQSFTCFIFHLVAFALTMLIFSALSPLLPINGAPADSFWGTVRKATMDQTGFVLFWLLFAVFSSGTRFGSIWFFHLESTLSFLYLLGLSFQSLLFPALFAFFSGTLWIFLKLFAISDPLILMLLSVTSMVLVFFGLFLEVRFFITRVKLKGFVSGRPFFLLWFFPYASVVFILMLVIMWNILWV